MANVAKRVRDQEKTLRQSVILVLLYLIPASQALLPIDDPDIWWHLRTGQWIIEHRTVPTMDPFSDYGLGRIWIAYSWLFEIIVYGLYSAFGLVGLVLFTVLLSLTIALALHLLVRRARFPFVVEIGLTAIGLFCLKPDMTPRPWLFSILFFILELHILIGRRESKKLPHLYFLPLIFLFWANLHIQFIYGLALLLLIAAEPVIRQMIPSNLNTGHAESISVNRVTAIVMLSILATFINPYHIHLYKPLFEYAVQTRVFENIEEFHPMFFRSPEDWFVLALALGAAFCLGWRRENRLFSYLLLAMGAFLAFRARRDAWVLVIASLAIVSEWRNGTAREAMKLSTRTLLFITAGIILCLFVLAYYRDISETSLRSHVGKVYPVNAATFVKTNGGSGPLYNHLDWGGYLIWALPSFPVSMDGRTNLHGEERIERSLATWAGYPGWNLDPELSRAGLIIADIRKPLTSLLRTNSRFQLIYEDEIAAVFAPHKP